jgi:site-specific recombinase XerC
MAHLFKPVTVKPIPRNAVRKTIDGQPSACWTNRKGRKVTAPLTSNGKKCRVESPTWWIEYTAFSGKPARKKGFKDKQATWKLALDLEAAAEDVRGGRAAPRNEGPTHLGDYLEDFRFHLESRGRSPSHVSSVLHNACAVIEATAITTAATVDCERITAWLLSEQKRRNWSSENVNRYIQFARQFGRWLVKTKRARANPFDGLSALEVRGESTRTRRRLSNDELDRLIDAARSSPVTLAVLAGPDRARLYLLAAYTGLRLATLASLTPAEFVWQKSLPAAVSVPARMMKTRKALLVPLHPDVAQELARWLRSRQAGQPIFVVGDWSERGARLVAHDLAAARKAWIAEGSSAAERRKREQSDTLRERNNANEVFDFHSLRVQFVSNLAIAGVPLTAAQQLAGHSTPSLTANIYTKWGPSEQAENVAKLPSPGKSRGGRRRLAG